MGSDYGWRGAADMLDILDLGVFVTGSGQDLQKVSVVSQLPQLLQDNNEECIRRVVPKIRELLPVSRTEMQVEASDVFRRILKEEDVPRLMYAQTFLPTILNLMDSRDPDIGEMWLDTLIDVMELLPKETIRKDVLPRAISKGQMMQSVSSRLFSCRMLSSMATCLDALVIQKELLPAVQALCQDVEYEVRACMCQQLHIIAKAVCLESTKLVILPELVELVNDEHVTVRLAGMEALVNIVQLLDEGTRNTVVIPLAVKLCQQALQSEDSSLLSCVSKYLGELLHVVSGNLSASQKEWFFDFYRKLCCNGLPEMPPTVAQQQQQQQQQQRSKTDVNDNVTQAIPRNSSDTDIEGDDHVTECRANAATNFPAVLGLYAGVPLLEARLCESFSRLCKDPSAAVRQRAAHGFHEVARTLTAHLSLLARDMVCLLRDDSHEVLQGLIYGLSVTLEAFGTASALGQPNGSKHFVMPQDFLSAILTCEAAVSTSHDWRLQEALLLELSALTKCCSSESLYQKLVPVLFHKLTTSARAVPVRRAAVRTLLVVLRSNCRLAQRSEICRKIVHEFGKSQSFRHRMLFIDMCIVTLDLYSTHFFVRTFGEHLLSLANDAVPNVRLRVYSLVPRLWHAAQWTSDDAFAQQVADLTTSLLPKERDRDALDALQTAADKLGLKMDGTGSSFKVNTSVPANDREAAAAKMEERRRLAEEQAQLEEEEKNEEAGKKADKKSQRIANSKFVLDPKDKVKRAATSRIPMSPHLAFNKLEQQKTPTSLAAAVAAAGSESPGTGTKRVNTPLPASATQTPSPRMVRKDQPPANKNVRSTMLPTSKRAAGSTTPIGSSAAGGGFASPGSPVLEPSTTCAVNGRVDSISRAKAPYGSPTSSRRPTTVGATGRSLPVRVSRRD